MSDKNSTKRGGRRRARELALQALYAVDVGGGAVGDAISGDLWRDPNISEEDLEFAERLVLGVIEERTKLDEKIDRLSHHWRVDRMSAVDRNVLRLALWEMVPGSAVPAAVIMDEAIEIVRRYSTSESTSFINGVLDRANREQGGSSGGGKVL